MVPRFGVVLAVLAAVKAAEITLVTSPAGPIKQGDKVDLICTIPKEIKGRLDLVRFVRGINGVDNEISVNGALSDNFKTLARYSVKYDDNAASENIVLTLTIDEITGADGGDIGCYVYKDNPIGKVVDVIVHVPVKDVSFSVKDGGAVADGGDLAVKMGNPMAALCTVIVDGSDMAPTTTLKLGDTDITNEISKAVDKPKAAAKKGLLQLTYTESLEYTVKPEDNGKKLTCTSKTREFPAVSKSVTISVQTAPTLNCGDKVYAKVDSEKFQISCKATGSPLPNSAKWTWDHDGKTMLVPSGENKNGYEATIANSDASTAVVKLTIPKVGSNHFHVYNVEVTNAVGSASKTIELAEESSGSAASTTSTSKPTTQQPYVHVTEKPAEKEDPKEAASVKGGTGGAGSFHLFNVVVASVLSLLLVCLV